MVGLEAYDINTQRVISDLLFRDALSSGPGIDPKQRPHLERRLG